MTKTPDIGGPEEAETKTTYNVKKALEVWLSGQTQISAPLHAETELFIESLNPDLVANTELLKVYTDFILGAYHVYELLEGYNRDLEEAGENRVGTSEPDVMVRGILAGYAKMINFKVTKAE